MTTYRTPLSQDYDWQLSVASRRAAPVGSEAKGTRYLITVGSGDFTGYSNYIATAKQANPSAPAHWYFDAPLEGMATYVKDEDKVYQYITSWLELRLSCLFDVDRDTGIEVEQSADEDKIHFKTAGTERMVLDSNGLGGSCFTNINPTNLITNGDFELWSAGANAVPDGWTLAGSGTITREASTIKLGTYSAKLTSATMIGIYEYIHTVKGILYWQGRTVTFSCWVWCDTANRARLRIGGSAETFSSYHTGNSTWQLLTVTKTIESNAPYVYIGCNQETGNGISYFDGAMLVEGSCIFAFADKPVDSGGFIYTDKTNGRLGIGVVSPTSRLHIQTASGVNQQTILIEQLDTTNNPVCAEINNDGTNHGLYIHQDGVLAASKYGLYVYSNAALTNSQLVFINQANASAGGVEAVVYIQNSSTTGTLFINQAGILQGGVAAFTVYASQAQVNVSHLASFRQGNAASTATDVEIDNDGTGHALYIHQDGVLAASKYGLYVYSNAVQVNSALARIHLANASSDYYALEVVNASLGTGVYINQSSVLGAGRNSLVAYSNAPQTNSSLVKFVQAHTASNQAVLEVQNEGSGKALYIIQAEGNGVAEEINNDGTNHGLYIHQDGVLAASKYGLYVYSNASQVNAPLVFIHQDNASSTSGVVTINNDGTGIGLTIIQNGNASYGVYFQFNNTYFGQYIDQVGILGTDYHALYVYSNAAQTNGNTELVKIKQDNASSTYGALTTINDGTGIGVLIIQNGNGTAVEIDNDGTNHGLYIHQDGVLAVNQRGLFVYSNTAQTNSNTCMIWAEQHNASTNREVVVIENYGTGVALFIEQYGNGIAQEINNDGTNHALYIHQDGVLAANKYGLYVYSNSAQVNAPLVNFVQDNASSDKDLLVLQQDGTGASLYIDHNGAISDAVAGIRIDGCDVANGSNAVVVSSVGPAGIGTSGISRWLLVDISGTRYYIPMWT